MNDYEKQIIIAKLEKLIVDYKASLSSNLGITRSSVSNRYRPLTGKVLQLIPSEQSLSAQELSMETKEKYPSCRDCGRIILGTPFYSYGGAREPRPAKKSEIKRGWGLQHKGCTSSQSIDSTHSVASVERARVHLEFALKDLEDSETKQADARRNFHHLIWVHHGAKIERLKDWQFCQKPIEKRGLRAVCFLCGETLIQGDYFSVSKSGTNINVCRVPKATNAMHRKCADEWISESIWSAFPTLEISEAEANLKTTKAITAAKRLEVSQKSLDVTKAITEFQSRRVISIEPDVKGNQPSA